MPRRPRKVVALTALALLTSSPLALARSGAGTCQMVGPRVTLPHVLSVHSTGWHVCSTSGHSVQVRAANQSDHPGQGWVDYQSVWITAPPCSHDWSTWGIVPPTASPRYGQPTRHLLADPAGAAVQAAERQCKDGGAGGRG